jgi:SOS response regulatory protein OraA/RecX
MRRVADKELAGSLADRKVSSLLEEGRLDDVAFVRWYIAEKNYFKPRGRIRIKSDLAQKGIPADLIERILEENDIPETSLIEQLLDTKYKTLDLDDEEVREKLVVRLQRQGFRYDDIKTAIEDYAQKE